MTFSQASHDTHESEFKRIWAKRECRLLPLEQRWDEKVGLGLLVQCCRIKEERLQQDKKTKLEERKMAQGERRDGRDLGVGFFKSLLILRAILKLKYKVPGKMHPLK